MATDDFRIRVDVEGGEAHGFLEQLRHGLGRDAEELAAELRHHRLAVSRDGDTIFVYTGTRDRARVAHLVVERELARHGLKASVSPVEHWLRDEERWSYEPVDEDWEEEHAERGFAPWEVRIECESHEEAERLADALADDGYLPVRRWRYLIVGAATREEAEELARRTRGQVELGGEIVWEVASGNPFAIFG